MPRKKKQENRKRSPQPRHPWWLVVLFALLAAGGVAGGVYAVWPYIASATRGEPTGRTVPLESPGIPPEVVWMVPPGEDAAVPASIDSKRPVVRVRRRNDGLYELLYWGNPVRKAYSYSVTAVGLGRSALVGADGKPQAFRPLPVKEPARKDGRLPLQRFVPLVRLDGGDGEFFAARVAVHDAATGAVLCSGDYLLECRKQSGQGRNNKEN